MRRFVQVTALALLCTALGARAAYPDHPIKVVHGFAAGGGADILLRTIIPAISENLGTTIVVE